MFSVIFNRYDLRKIIMTKLIGRLLSLYVCMICGEKINWGILLQVI